MKVNTENEAANEVEQFCYCLSSSEESGEWAESSQVMNKFFCGRHDNQHHEHREHHCYYPTTLSHSLRQFVMNFERYLKGLPFQFNFLGREISFEYCNFNI